jgi:hypothetical protein
MRLLAFGGLQVAFCLLAGSARADGPKLTADFPTAASHAELAKAACALSLVARVDGEPRPLEVHALEDDVQLCANETSYPNAVVVLVRMVSRGDLARVTLVIDAPADASPAMLADYRAALGVAEEAVHHAALDAIPDIPPPHTRPRSEETSAEPAPKAARTNHSLVTAGTVMMTVASILTTIPGLAIAGSSTYPGTSPVWPFVPFVGMTVFSATYTQVADCNCPSNRPLSIFLSSTLNAVQIAGLVLVLVGSTSSKKASVARILTSPFAIGGTF